MTQKPIEIADRMKDGTVVIAVDLKENIALFAPEGIFGGNSDDYSQDSIVKRARAHSLHGHKDWRKITNKEASALAKDWEKVAPSALQGSAAPQFWGESCYDSRFGRIYRGGEADWHVDYNRYGSRPVPVVRSGPARS